MPLILLIAFTLIAPLPANGASEKEANDAFCARLNGEREVQHRYSHNGRSNYVLVDCETINTVIEGGLDKQSSLDSVQQALFAAHLTGKRPMVVIYDTDGIDGPYERQIRVACALAGVHYVRSPVYLPKVRM